MRRRSARMRIWECLRLCWWAAWVGGGFWGGVGGAAEAGGQSIQPALSQAPAALREPLSRVELIASPEPGWPQWRGPRRDGKSDETGLLGAWPEGGPRLLWKRVGVGRGYSAPVIAGGRIHLGGDVGEELRLFTLDLEGQPLWEAVHGASWKNPYPGARASGAVLGGRLFHLNAHGRLAAFEAATGRELWAVSLFERFGGRNITWALSEGVIAEPDRIYVTVGGTEALMAAVDPSTGATVWASEPLRLGAGTGPSHQRVAEGEGTVDSASYASPILVRAGERRLLVGCSLRHVFGVDAETGRLLWTRPLVTRYSVIAATPVLVGNAIFVTAPDTKDAALYRLNETGSDVERVWQTTLDTCQGGVVAVGDALYGGWYRPRRGWAALDARTGQVRYELSTLVKGAVTWADGRLYCMSENGEVALLKPGIDGFEVMGRFQLAQERQNDVWTHPVILEGRLYLRHQETLYCYSIR